MKALALLPLLLLLATGCAAAHPAAKHKVVRPAKTIVIVAPAKTVTKTVIIRKGAPVLHTPARTVIIKSESPTVSTTIRKS